MSTMTISQRRDHIMDALPDEIDGKCVVLWDDDGDDYERGTTVILGAYGPIPEGTRPEVLVDFLLNADCNFAILDLVLLSLQKRDALMAWLSREG